MRQARVGGCDWAAVCDAGFDRNTANVACRQLGFKRAASFATGVRAEGLTDKFGVSFLHCAKGSEVAVKWCISESAAATAGTCASGGGVSLSCGWVDDMRLREGVVQARVNGGGWGNVCADEFGPTAAAHVCKTVGMYDAALEHNNLWKAHEDTLPPGTEAGDSGFVLSNLVCPEEATDVNACTFSPSTHCVSGHGVSLVCGIEELGLSHGTDGLLSSKINNATWSPVCADDFDSAVAGVVCRQLSPDGPCLACAAVPARLGARMFRTKRVASSATPTNPTRPFGLAHTLVRRSQARVACATSGPTVVRRR